jgi:hypothetical protein
MTTESKEVENEKTVSGHLHEMAHMKSHGFNTYDSASELIHELDLDIDKFIREFCH